MTKLISKELVQLFKNYPLYTQENESDPLVVAKLFDAYGSATWYLTEYNPEEQVAFGYVTGLAYDEWGYVSLSELAEIRHPILGPRIERDRYFDQQRFSALGLLETVQ
ncbi:MAG: DUF2958 domain-containing protein [Gammaproteobacteria bacterium]|jgi:hypothetical protein|nr:DUF2958 domain-containing protein [Gammaproteobacteria bacterium]MBT3717775.1 DUF2958 domain-containing protein [Gammaproteobacteria bacterium]MBT3844583.1 DUF2958 domain-containing protein [Gammaproteobacteria bacterium]MBT4547923.1 DUF2958 domain-containing protein [Gammaproteobacteria bacterium]MBT6878502.1 DUF2958 domain-containing protein [Gammaproteobacteria bacterium]